MAAIKKDDESIKNIEYGASQIIQQQIIQYIWLNCAIFCTSFSHFLPKQDAHRKPVLKYAKRNNTSDGPHMNLWEMICRIDG